MIDVIRNPHIPLYDMGRAQGSRASLYWGVGLAVLLHLLLAWYLIHQSFGVAAPEPAAPPAPSIGLTFEKPTPPPPPPEKREVVNRVIPHDSPLPPPPTLQTTPINPQVKPLAQTGPAQPPILDNGPAQTSASASSEPAYVTPRWARFPDGAALASYYPPRALDNEVEGVSMVECTVTDEGGHIRCQAISESPAGYGFGAATARMVQERGRIDVSHGDVRVGAKLRTTVKWTLG